MLTAYDRGLACRRLWELAAFLVAIGTCLITGCTRGPGSKDASSSETGGQQTTPSHTASDSARGDTLQIQIDGADYLWDAAAWAQGFCCGGLHSLGDLDGDNVTDLVVAVHRKSARSSAEQGMIEARSGKNGSLLWQLQGGSAAGSSTDPIQGSVAMKDIAVIDDLDRDGLPDIYFHEAVAKRSALLISGRTGAVIGRHAMERNDVYGQPIRCHDYNGDGVPDLFFCGGSMAPLGLEIRSSKDLTVLAATDCVWPDAGSAGCGWVLGRFHDVNRDGVQDCLVRRELERDSRGERYTYEYAVLSGKDLSLLHRFVSDRPRVTADTCYALCGDLNGDGVGDFVFASRAGGGPDGHTSCVRAVSASDGVVLWQVGGDQLAGGRQGFAVDAETKQKTSTASDVGFGSPLVSVPDLNGDGADEMVTAALAPDDSRSRQSLYVLSGRDGKPVHILQMDATSGRLTDRRTQLALLLSTPDEVPRIAAAASAPGSVAMIAVFALPQQRH